MSKPTVIRFRCYCIECTNGDKPKYSNPQEVSAELGRHDINANEPNPQLIADSIDRVLFGA